MALMTARPVMIPPALEGAHREAERPRREDHPLLASRLTILTETTRRLLCSFRELRFELIMSSHAMTYLASSPEEGLGTRL